MIISSSITLGQITFALRIAVQVLGYGGLALISVITLASVSRVAPIDTHDTINRIVGASTATLASLRWIFDRVRHKHPDPLPSTRFSLLIFLSISYSVFASLSDIGFLGFYACPVPSPNITDFPASVTSYDAALNLVKANMVNGTDVSKVKVYRCNSSTVVYVGGDLFKSTCVSWYNSTYADSNFFNDVKSTNTDAMMPRQLTHYSHLREAFIDLNSFYLGPNTHRLTLPTIQRGLAIEPHDKGVQMITGAPQLQTSKRVDIEKTLAVEVDVGCMSLGVRDISVGSGGGSGKMIFATNGTWREFTGPKYMEGVLKETVDHVRHYLEPFFNSSTLDSSGFIYSINSSDIAFSATAYVGSYRLPLIDYSFSPGIELMGNCTQSLREYLGITSDLEVTGNGDMCGFLGVGGSYDAEGIGRLAFNRMVCATATQVNLVDATVNVNAENKVSLHLTHLPSDIEYVLADYWDKLESNNKTVNVGFSPYERFTLSPNSTSPSLHFVRHRNEALPDSSLGPGSAGNVVSSIGHHILSASLGVQPEYSGLGVLDEGLSPPNFETSQVTKWLGEVGGSYFLASLGYNGWVALQSPPIQVVSTGGSLGSCYNPYYAISFVPFILSTAVLFIWVMTRILHGSWFGTKILDTGYGGVTPYTAVVCFGAPPKETLLAWEASPQPHLQVIHQEYILTGKADTTALNYFKSALPISQDSSN